VASISQLTVSRLSRQCGILNISQPYRPPRPVMGIAFFLALLNTKFGRDWLNIIGHGLCEWKHKLDHDVTRAFCMISSSADTAKALYRRSKAILVYSHSAPRSSRCLNRHSTKRTRTIVLAVCRAIFESEFFRQGSLSQSLT
jgi:hypothetical protein